MNVPNPASDRGSLLRRWTPWPLATALVLLLAPVVGAQKEYKPTDPDEHPSKKEESRWRFIEDIELKPGKREVKVLVGWQRGRIRHFKFAVERRGVRIEEVEVHYGKGKNDLYVIDEWLDAGEESGLFPVDRDRKGYLRKLYVRFALAGSDGDEDPDRPAVLILLGSRE